MCRIPLHFVQIFQSTHIYRKLEPESWYIQEKCKFFIISENKRPFLSILSFSHLLCHSILHLTLALYLIFWFDCMRYSWEFWENCSCLKIVIIMMMMIDNNSNNFIVIIMKIIIIYYKWKNINFIIIIIQMTNKIAHRFGWNITLK